MRLPLSTLILSATALSLLFTSPVLSIHPHALSHGNDHRRSPASHILTSRQHHIARDLLDVCINANVDLAADASQLLGLGSLLGDIGLGTKDQLCLCLKDLNLYLDTNDNVQALVGLLGKNAVSTVITALINTSPNAQQCTFPTNAHHTCNNSDPCHYECDENYIQNGEKCVCALPYLVCNGVCGKFPQGCGSSVPAAKRVELARTLPQAQTRCKPHERVCGVPGKEGTLAFECVDVTTSKDSCGGCVVPHSFAETALSLSTKGKDCSAISNAKSAACIESHCVINSCIDGWTPSHTQSECTFLPGSLHRMRRVQKRGDPLSANTTAVANVDSDLIKQLLSIVNTVEDMSYLASSSLGASSAPMSATTASIYALFGVIDQTTFKLVSSSTIGEMESTTATLIQACTSLTSKLSTCDCVKSLGLLDATNKLEGLLAALLRLTNSYDHIPIVPGSPTSTQSPGSPIVNSPSQAVNLSAILTGLGLDSDGNYLLSGDGLGTGVIDGSNAATTDLVSQIIALVELVIKLRNDATSTVPTSSQPSEPSGSSIDLAGLLNPIIVTTSNVANSTSLAHLLDTTNTLLAACRIASRSLGPYNLEGLTSDVEAITLMTLRIQEWCQTRPIASSPTSTVSTDLLASSFTSVPSVIPSVPDATSSENTPIVIGLSDLLTGLQVLGPVKASIAVGGLGSGPSNSVNGILDGIGIGPANAKRREVSGNVSSTITSELRTRLEGLVDLVLALEDDMSSLPSHDLEATSTSLDDQSIMGVAHATGRLLQSSTIGALLDNLDAFINATVALQDLFVDCQCVAVLGMDRAQARLNLVNEAAVDLKNWCTANIIVAPYPGNPTTASLGPLLPTGGAMVVPPNAASRPTVSKPSTSTLSSDTPIIIGLDRLLDRLGLPGSTGVATADGLGDGLDSTVNDSLDAIAGIGPSGLQPRAGSLKKIRQGLMRSNKGISRKPTRRQVAATANVALGSDILTEVDALVSLVLGLTSAAGSASIPSLPTVISTSPGIEPTTAPPAFVPNPNGSNSILYIGPRLADDIVDATVGLLSCQTYGQLAAETEVLAYESVLALQTIEACNCTDSYGLSVVYQYLLQIVDVALVMQNWCHRHSLTPPAPPSSYVSPHVSISAPSPPRASEVPPSYSTPITGSTPISGTGNAVDEPLVVGLTKLLNGLGLDIQADVVVDKLLGNGVNHSLNSVLNDLGIGPNGARRRSYDA